MKIFRLLLAKLLYPGEFDARMVTILENRIAELEAENKILKQEIVKSYVSERSE